jgi:RNA polymerase sigma-70 factor (ECF subfamily)
MRGDEEAYTGLMAIAGDRLLAIAYRILRDVHRAEDAVQAALLGAWRDLPTLRDPDRFEAWLTRLLIRSCQDNRRRAIRHRTVELRIELEDGPGVADHQATLAVADQLERSLRRLTVDQRTVLVLTYYLDLPIAEAAAVIGIPTGTMKSRLNRAISALRATVDADDRPGVRTAERPT